MHSRILPSRAALVDRIALQFEYGQNLINLVGDAGLGKSYLLEAFVTDKYEAFNKAYIQLNATLSDVELMTQLLEHSFPRPLIDQNQTLSENFFRLAKEHGSVQCVWVLDGARHLSREMRQQLEILSTRSPITLYILTASQSPEIFGNAVDLHLEPLTQRESLQLMSWFYTELPPLDDPVFRTFLQTSQGNPALLLSWDATHSTEIRAPRKRSWRIHFMGAVLLVVLIIAGLLYRGDIKTPGSALFPTTSPEPEVALTKKETSTPVAEPAQVEPKAGEKNIQEALVARQPAGSEVADIVAELESAPSQSESGQEVEDANAVNISNPRVSVNQEPVKPEEGHSAAQAGVQQSNEEQAADETLLAPSPSLVDNAWFLNQPDDRVVIQLVGVADANIIGEFFEDHKLNPELAKVYMTHRQGKAWYVVTYGSYAAIPKAQQARDALSEDLKRGQPFIKTISRIKQELAH